MALNYSTAVMLVNENIKAVLVTYEPDADHSTAKRTMYKTTDHSLKQGDLVITPTDTRHKFTIAMVDEFDAEVDYEDDTDVKWIVGRAPTEAYVEILKKEKEMIDVVKASEKRAKREEIRKNMLGLQEDQNLESLAIANLSGTTTEVIETTTEEEKK